MRKSVCPFSLSEVLPIFSITYLWPNHAMIDIVAPMLNLETLLLPLSCKLPNQAVAARAWGGNIITYFLLWLYAEFVQLMTHEAVTSWLIP